MTCTVCNHDNRLDIEKALLCISSGVGGQTIEDVADEFNIHIRDLQVHAVMHVPLDQTASQSNDDVKQESIVQSINKVEAVRLHRAADDYLCTLKNLSAKINKIINTSDETSLRLLTKSTVDLYLGSGAELRNITNAIVQMNQTLNGENNAGAAALADLIGAIRGAGN